MSETNTTRSGLKMRAMTSIISSPETMAKPLWRSMTTSPWVTGMMPTWLMRRMTSSLSTTIWPWSMTKQDPGDSDAAGMPTAISSDVTRSPSSMASWWTMAAGATCPKSTRPFWIEYLLARTWP